MASPDTRTITLVDIPLLRRLSSNSMILDSEMGLTRDARGAHSALLSNILFSRGVYTLVARSDHQHVVGQFRYRQEDLNAHIVYLAPTLADDTENTIWLHILDAMAREAGKHGAHALVAEVEPDSHLFQTLRTARFATYARQTIWRHTPVKGDKTQAANRIRPETGNDQVGIMSLICSTIPPMIQQVMAPPGDMNGWVYRKNGQVEAYIAVSEGDQGIYVLPYIHPDVMSEAADILEAVLVQQDAAQKVPIYVCVRSYQAWLETALQTLAFEAWVEQAIMVKHIAAGIRQQAYSPLKLKGKLETVQNIAPPIRCTLDPPGTEDKTMTPVG
jgi:hypothetical protein